MNILQSFWTGIIAGKNWTAFSLANCQLFSWLQFQEFGMTGHSYENEQIYLACFNLVNNILL